MLAFSGFLLTHAHTHAHTHTNTNTRSSKQASACVWLLIFKLTFQQTVIQAHSISVPSLLQCVLKYFLYMRQHQHGDMQACTQTQGFAWTWETYLNKRKLITSTNWQPVLFICKYGPACCEGHRLGTQFSLFLSALFYSFTPFPCCCGCFFFFKSMFTFALIHTLLLDWFIVPYPQEMDQIGEIVVCVNVCVCFIHMFGQRRGCMQSCLPCCTLLPLSSAPSSLHPTDALQFIPQCLHLFLCWIAKCYSQRRFRMISFDLLTLSL